MLTRVRNWRRVVLYQQDREEYGGVEAGVGGNTANFEAALNLDVMRWGRNRSAQELTGYGTEEK